MKSSPIFIIGSERSGTNIFRTLLSNHSNLGGPTSPQLLNSLLPYERYYGDVNESKNNRLLKDHLHEIVNHRFSDWNIEFEEIEKLNESSLISFIDRLYNIKAREIGASRYVAKEVNTHNYFYRIKKELPSAKFLYIVRDPREQVASCKRTPLQFQHPYDAIIHWNKVQNACIDLLFGNPDSVYLIKYEELIENVEKVMTNVLTFLNEDIESNCFENTNSNTNTEWNSLWENLSRPVSNNTNKHKKYLSEAEVNMIETISESTMIELNYLPYSQRDWNNSIYKKLGRIYTKKLMKSKVNSIKGIELIKDRMQLTKKIRADIKNNYFSYVCHK